MLRALTSAGALQTEPVSSPFQDQLESQIVAGSGIGRPMPNKTSGYIYRDLSEMTPPVDPSLPISNVFEESSSGGDEPNTPAYRPESLPITAWTRDGQAGMVDQVDYNLEAWWETGAEQIGAMPYPSEYGISELVSITPQKDPILLGPAGKIGMGWPQTVTTPPWIDIGDQTPYDVIGLGAGVNVNEGSYGAAS